MTSKNRYSNLNALRAISALGIAIMHYHANMVVKPQLGYLSSDIIPWFTWFVFLFFMISAFSMCCGYYEKIRAKQLDVNQFYSKRYKRVLPFFAFLCVVDVILDFSKESLAQAFMDCTLVFNLLPNPDIKVIGVGWFLGMIFVFYMLFPFYVFLIHNKQRAWFVLGLSLIVNFLCQTYFFTDRFVDFDPARHNILYSSPLLIAGGLCYLYKDDLSLYSMKMGKYGLALCVLLTVSYFVIPQSLWTLNHIIPLLIVFTAWLVYAIGDDQKWMHNNVMDFLSEHSLEIYLCHMVFFRVVEKCHFENYISSANILFIGTCVLGLALTIFFSYVAKRVLSRLGL